MTRLQIIIGPLIVLSVGALILVLIHNSPEVAASKPATQPRRPQETTSSNPAHEVLLQADPRLRARALAAIVSSSGDACIGKTTFFMGLDPNDRRAYWSVTCSNRRSFEVAIEANAKGSTSVVDCAVMKKAANISCFQRLDAQ